MRLGLTPGSFTFLAASSTSSKQDFERQAKRLHTHHEGAQQGEDRHTKLCGAVAQEVAHLLAPLQAPLAHLRYREARRYGSYQVYILHIILIDNYIILILFDTYSNNSNRDLKTILHRPHLLLLQAFEGPHVRGAALGQPEVRAALAQGDLRARPHHLLLLLLLHLLAGQGPRPIRLPHLAKERPTVEVKTQYPLFSYLCDI